MKIRSAVLLLLASAVLVEPPLQTRSQSLSSPTDSSAATASMTTGSLDLTFVRPRPRRMVNTYAFDAFGPYAFVSTALIAGLDQETNTPPEWKQGFEGYAKRFGSDFGIAIVGTTTRYGLAAVFKEDTSYYRCECQGLSPRLRHAVISTLTARRGGDGHRVFSIPALIAPYAASTTAVYGWYPNRFSAKDALRMGNYSLLESVGSNIALEFLYSGPHSLFSHLHLNHAHAAPGSSPSQ